MRFLTVLGIAGAVFLSSPSETLAKRCAEPIAQAPYCWKRAPCRKYCKDNIPTHFCPQVQTCCDTKTGTLRHGPGNYACIPQNQGKLSARTGQLEAKDSAISEKILKKIIETQAAPKSSEGKGPGKSKARDVL